MSFGLHRLWKDYFVNKLAPPPGTRVLDVAGGTGTLGVANCLYAPPIAGDIACRIVDYMDTSRYTQSNVATDVEVTVLDANTEMLEFGAKKLNQKSTHLLMHIHIANDNKIRVSLNEEVEYKREWPGHNMADYLHVLPNLLKDFCI